MKNYEKKKREIIKENNIKKKESKENYERKKREIIKENNIK